MSTVTQSQSPAKRAMPSGGFTARANARKIARLSKQVARNRPEMKHKDFIFNTQITNTNLFNIDLTDIAQGTDDNERIGRMVRIHTIDIRGRTCNNGGSGVDNVNLYIVSPRDGVNAPLSTDFLGVTCGHPLVNRLIEFWHWNSQKQLQDVDSLYRFRYQPKVHYESQPGTAAIRNSLYLTIRNSSGSNVTPNIAVRVWYTDA